MPTDAPATILPESDVASFAARSRRGNNAGRPQRLIDVFDEEFFCISADEALLRDYAYRVRYALYCIENTFEDRAANPNGRETDEFDDHAPHKLLIHRASGTIAGVVRLILPERDRPNHGLPFNALVGQSASIDNLALPAKTAEASRFAIARQFRVFVRQTVAEKPKLLAQAALLRNVSIGLMRAIVEMAAEHGMTHLCAVMEPALLRLLARLGVHFRPIAPMIEYHGWRQPCFADLDELLTRTWAERREVWEVLTGTGSIWPLSRICM